MERLMSAPRVVTMVSVHKLKPNSQNTRTHSKKQIRQLASSIQQFGWTSPILVDENHVILAGHGRHQAALQLGLREVPLLSLPDLARPSGVR
jgi:ParB-like chromosome segregation protein Spo0J